MAIYQKAKSILKRLKRDESGTAALSWAVSVTVVLGAMGAAMDFAVLANADARAQAIADNTALAAAIYVKNHGRPPEQGGLIEGDKHSAESLGYDYNSLVLGGAAGVKVDINYDDDAKEVTTTVTGQTNPILVQLLGVEDLDFKSQSVASYLDIQNKFPASIALVLDNSGSMQFDDILPEKVYNFTHPRTCQRRFRDRWGRVITQNYDCSYTHKHGDQASGAIVRLDGLKSSVKLFQTELESRLGTEDASSRRTLRMGMLPYSSAIIAPDERVMDWGYIPEGGNNGINAMVANGGTNSSPPMSTAQTWLEAEDAIHEDEAERAGETYDKDLLKFVVFMTDGQNTQGNRRVEPGPTGQWHAQINGNWFSRSSFRSGYTEGTLVLLTDSETVQACREMKEQGVKIFTIGYALEDYGDFRVNGWDDREDDETIPVSSDVRSSAYAMMQSCAYSEDHFITAADAGQLEAAFDEIQNAIVLELIRLKS